MGSCLFAKPNRYMGMAAAMVLALLAATASNTGPARDIRAWVRPAQAMPPSFVSASPVWDENIRRDWWPRFVGYDGHSSLQATLANLSQSVPENQLPAALRVVIDTASPTVFRSTQARDAWQLALEDSGRDSGQAAAMLHGRGAEVLIEPFDSNPPLDPEKAWLAAMDHPALGDLPKPPLDLDMDGARRALEEAVVATGLAGVRVPVPYWEDPRHVWRLAKSIARADAQLSEITGWPSPVLGMGGRIMLTIGATGNSTILHTSQGLMDVRTDWASLAHEWFHALDYALAPELLRFATPDTSYITQSSGVFRLGRSQTQAYRQAFDRMVSDVHNPPLSPSDRLALDLAARRSIRDSLNNGLVIYPSTMVQGLGETDRSILLAPVGLAVPEQGSPWLHWRMAASGAQDRFDRPHGWFSRFAPMSAQASYLQNKMEIMAFAFSTHVSNQMQQSLLAHSQERAGQVSPSYRPMLIEARALENSWGAFFSQLRPWHEMDVLDRLGKRAEPVIESTST